MLACSTMNPPSRKQQMEIWESSDTNKEVISSRSADRVKFPIDVQFFAACSSSELDEVKALLFKGVDINVVNADGLTVLHQACIDNDYELAEFLIEHGANVDAQDNEGWTPLHACASCSYMELAKLLLDNGADVGIVSFEMELPIDVGQCDEMLAFLRDLMEKKGIDATNARNAEEQLMLKDANSWLRSGKYPIVIDPRTGATALHVAAAKNYSSVLELLLKLPGIDVDVTDNDGWTPLHAAAHWAKERPLRLLSAAGAGFEKITHTNQSIFDVADSSVTMLLRQLRETQRLERLQAEERAALQASMVPKPSSNSDMDKEASVEVPEKKATPEEKGDVAKTSPEPQVNTKAKEDVPEPKQVSIPTTATSIPIVKNKPIKPNTEENEEDAPPVPVLSSVVSNEKTVSVATNEKPSTGNFPASTSVEKPTKPIDVNIPPGVQQTRRVSAVLAPSKSEETEAQRSSKARIARSTRRPTQGIANDVFEKAKRISEAHIKSPPQPATLPSTPTVLFQSATTTTTAVSDAGIVAPTEKDKAGSSVIIPPSTTISPTSSTLVSSCPAAEEIQPSPNDVDAAKTTSSMVALSPTFQRPRRTARDRVPTGKLNTSDVIAAANLISTKAATDLTNNRDGSEDSSPIPRPTSRFLRSSALTMGSTNNGDRVTPSPARQFPSTTATTTVGSSIANSGNGSAQRSSTTAFANNPGDQRHNWRETIDYRRLYEEERAEKERLRRVLDQVNREVAMLRTEIPRLQQHSSNTATLHSSSSSILIPSRSAGNVSSSVTRDMSPVSEIERLRQENAKMADENKSLIRVISKLSNRT